MISFSNVTTQTLKGHAAVVLMDADDFRLKKTNSANRAGGEDKERPQPFGTLACAWSAARRALKHMQKRRSLLDRSPR